MDSRGCGIGDLRGLFQIGVTGEPQGPLSGWQEWRPNSAAKNLERPWASTKRRWSWFGPAAANGFLAML
jgi:hypothetical protein